MTPTTTLVAANPTAQQLALDSAVSQRMMTVQFDATVAAQANSMLTQTANAPLSSTDPTLQAQAVNDRVNQLITLTAQANVEKASTALQSTVSAQLRVVLTATAAVPKNANWKPITPDNATQVDTLTTLSGHTAQVTGVAFSPDSQMLASSSKDGSVRVWAARAGSSVMILPGLTDRTAVAFSPDGSHVAASSSDSPCDCGILRPA